MTVIESHNRKRAIIFSIIIVVLFAVSASYIKSSDDAHRKTDIKLPEASLREKSPESLDLNQRFKHKETSPLPLSDADQAAYIDAEKKLKFTRDCLGAALILEDLVSAGLRCKYQGGTNCSDINTIYAYSQYSREKAEWANSEISQCPGIKADDLSRSYFEAMIQAAKLGDIAAQACYIGGDFGGVRLSENEQNDYKKDGSNYVADAFSRGDWSVVNMLMWSATGIGGDHQIYALLATDGHLDLFFVYYKLNRLMRLGATGDYANILDNMAAIPVLSNGKAALSDAQIKEGNAWAEQIYTDYYSNSPKMEKKPASKCIQPIQ